MSDDGAWMFSELAAVPGVRYAVLLTVDGLVKDRSLLEQGLPLMPTRDEADALAAACSGLHSLGVSVARRFGEGVAPADGSADAPSPKVHQVVVRFDGGFLFLRDAGERTQLAVVTGPKVDPGLLAQQMATQVAKLASALSTPARGVPRG